MPHLRRSGWGLAIRKPASKRGCYDIRAGWYGCIADEPNTPARAALHALLFVLENTEGNAIVAPDCLYVIGGFEGLRDTTAASHADLWWRIDRARTERSGGIRMHKVKAHPSVEAVVADRTVSMLHFTGNHYADRWRTSAPSWSKWIPTSSRGTTPW